MKLFISPHSDDAALFGAFAIQEHKPTVLTVYDSFVQVRRGHLAANWNARRREDYEALAILGADKIWFGGVSDEFENEIAVRALFRDIEQKWHPKQVWLPRIEENGHAQHNLVGRVGEEVFAKSALEWYFTYTRTRGKSVDGKQYVPNGKMVLKKLRAIACYETQISIDALGCWPHFLRDQNEYYL